MKERGIGKWGYVGRASKSGNICRDASHLACVGSPAQCIFGLFPASRHFV